VAVKRRRAIDPKVLVKMRGAGATVQDMATRYGVAKSTIYTWLSSVGGVASRPETSPVGTGIGTWQVIRVLPYGRRLMRCSCGTKRVMWGKGHSPRCRKCAMKLRVRRVVKKGEFYGQWKIMETTTGCRNYAPCKCACGLRKGVLVMNLTQGNPRAVTRVRRGAEHDDG